MGRMGRVQTERESDEAVAGAAVLCVSCFCQELIDLADSLCKGGLQVARGPHSGRWALCGLG